MERVCVEVQEITKESLKFEILQGDDFCSVLNRYMSEQKLTVNMLSFRSGICKNAIIDYRVGKHLPKDIHKAVALCMGLQINLHRAEYLINLAHMSIGYDAQGIAYRTLICLAFSTAFIFVKKSFHFYGIFVVKIRYGV